jgi:hypothetical protein
VDAPTAAFEGEGGDLRKEVKGGARDPELVRDQYEDYWSTALDSARTIVAAEPKNLARAVNLCIAAFASRPRKVRRIRSRRIAALLAGRPLPPVLSPRCIDAITRVAITDLVAGCCVDDTQRIIELGSGWGTNLFCLWLNGGPRSAEYVAMEYTAAGREATQLLASIEPGLSMTVRPFDYHRPDLSEFRSNDRTVVFTSYSIEQITTLSDALFEELLAIPGLDRVIHVEPVSWQLLDQGAAGPVIGILSRVVPPRLSLELDVRRRSRSTAYNRDLIGRLRSLERAGRIRIERIAKNYVGPNPLNPGTAIVWRPAR